MVTPYLELINLKSAITGSAAIMDFSSSDNIFLDNLDVPSIKEEWESLYGICG